MSAPVILPTIQNAPVNSIALRNSQIVRPFYVTPAWTRLRVGIRFMMTSGSTTNTDITGTPRLTLGFCSGSNIYGDLNGGHFAGVQTNGYMSYVSNGASYNIAANYTGIVRTLKKIGAVETIFSNDIETGNTYFAHDRATYTDKCNIIFFDLTRPQGPGLSGSLASGSYTGSYGRPYNWTDLNYFKWSENEFLTQLATPSPSFLQGQWATLNAGTFYINEIQDGYFDSVYVSWDREFPDSELRILNIGIAVLA